MEFWESGNDAEVLCSGWDVEAFSLGDDDDKDDESNWKYSRGTPGSSSRGERLLIMAGHGASGAEGA